MRLLALDFATSTGWAAWNGSVQVSGVEHFHRTNGERPGFLFARFNEWLLELLIRVDPSSVIYERPVMHQSSGPAKQIAMGLETRIMEACDKRDPLVHYSSLPAASLKKWTAGKGNAKKPEMIAAVCRRGFHKGVPHDPCFFLNDNEADALALLAYARAELVPMEATA